MGVVFDPLARLTDEARRLMHHADTLGLTVRVQLEGTDPDAPVAVAVRLAPDSEAARRRFRAAGREDRIIEGRAAVHLEPDLLPFAVEAALMEAMELHRTHLGLVIA